MSVEDFFKSIGFENPALRKNEQKEYTRQATTAVHSLYQLLHVALTQNEIGDHRIYPHLTDLGKNFQLTHDDVEAKIKRGLIKVHKKSEPISLMGYPNSGIYISEKTHPHSHKFITSDIYDGDSGLGVIVKTRIVDKNNHSDEQQGFKIRLPFSELDQVLEYNNTEALLASPGILSRHTDGVLLFEDSVKIRDFYLQMHNTIIALQKVKR